jgi:uncharacterized protein with NAD-binding domain and iron-sulfur cluster
MSENGNESCVAAKMDEGMTREEAEAACAAQKAVPPALQSTEEFTKYINEAVEKALAGYREQLVQRSIEAVQEVKRQLQEQTISAVKKSIEPETKTPLYKEDLATAIRQVQLENAGEAKKTQMENVTGTEGFIEHPGTMNDIKKNVKSDLDRFEKRFVGAGAPTGA